MSQSLRRLLQHPRRGSRPRSRGVSDSLGTGDLRLSSLPTQSEPEVTSMEGGRVVSGWTRHWRRQAMACTGTVSVGMKSHQPLSHIRRARCWATKLASWCRHWIMALECHQPSSLMMSVSTPPARSAIAPPAWSERALTSDAASPVAVKHWVAANRS